MRIDLGACAGCKKPVMAAEGQYTLYLTEILKRHDGTLISETSRPTHKKCRKLINTA